MKAGLAILALIVLGLLAIAAIVKVLVPLFKAGWRAFRDSRNENAEWEVDEDDLPDGSTQVRLVKPGEPPKLIGEPIPCTINHYDFLEKLEAARLEAEDRALLLNRGRKRLSR